MASLSESLAEGKINISVKGLEKVRSDMNGLQKSLASVGNRNPFANFDASKVSDQFSKIGSGGVQTLFGSIVSAVDKLKGKFEAISATAGKVGNVATGAFAGIVGSIAGLLAVADPVGMERLQLAFGRLALHLGRIFIPILRDVTVWVNKIADFFRDLDDSQRESILSFTKLALGGLAFVAVGAKLTSVIAGLIPVVTALAAKFAALWGAAAGPIGLIIAAVLAQFAAVALLVGGILVLSGRTASFFNLLTKVWGLFRGIGGGILAALQPVINLIGNIIGDMFDTFGKVIDKIKPVIGSLNGVFNKLAANIKPLFDAIGRHISKSFEVVGRIIETIADAIVFAIDEATALGATLGDLFKEMFGEGVNLNEFFVKVINNMTNGLNAIVPIVRTVFAEMAEGVRKVSEAVTAMGVLIANVKKGNFNIGDIQNQVNAKIGQLRDNREKVRNERDAAAAKEKGQDGDKFAPTVKVQAPQLLGITEAMRKVQTSATEDPKLALDRERNALAVRNNQLLQDVIDNMQKQVPLGLS